MLYIREFSLNVKKLAGREASGRYRWILRRYLGHVFVGIVSSSHAALDTKSRFWFSLTLQALGTCAIISPPEVMGTLLDTAQAIAEARQVQRH